MEQIKNIGLIISILMVLMAYLKQAIPRGKTTYLMKAVISIFILLSILQGVLRFDWDAIKSTFESTYRRDEAVWEKTAGMIEAGLKDEFSNFLKNQGVDAQVLDVSVYADQDGFVVEHVKVSGLSAETAKKLLAGRYQIGIAYFEVQNE